MVGTICGAALAVVSAVPVEAHRRGVVAECASGDFEDAVRQLTNRFSGVQGMGCGDDGGKVEGGSVAFQHAVGQEDDSIAGFELDDVLGVGGEGEHPERKVGRQVEGVDVAIACQIGGHVTGVDEVKCARVQVEASHQPGDEVVEAV